MTERELTRKYLMKKGGRFISNADESKIVTRWDVDLAFECYDEKLGESNTVFDIDKALDFFYGTGEDKADKNVISEREAAKIYLMGKDGRAVTEGPRSVVRWPCSPCSPYESEFECEDYMTTKTVSDIEEALDFLFDESDQRENIDSESEAISAEGEAISTESEAIDSVTYEDQNPIYIPAWERYVLSVEEASEYFGVSEEKIMDWIIHNPGAKWFFTVDGEPRIKRKLFEQFIDGLSAM